MRRMRPKNKQSVRTSRMNQEVERNLCNASVWPNSANACKRRRRA